jgi:CheY-like chemotaxis protein
MTPQVIEWNDVLIVFAAVALMGLAAGLLCFGLVVFDVVAAPLKKSMKWWNSDGTGRTELARDLLEEPSFVAFFQALTAGPVAPSACDTTTAEPLRAFFDSAPRQLADLGKLFSEIGLAPSEEGRRTILLESFRQAGTLRKQAELPELRPVWQVAFALEELLRQLLRKACNVTPSALRTAAGALDLLLDLCHQRVRPNFATAPPVRLMAVDDDPICRRAVSFALAKAFREPDLPPDGQAALSLAAQQTYDAIFLDVEMPGMDGFELCSKIHETELNRTTPVVFITRYDTLESRAQATLLGAQDFIVKPFLVFEITVKAMTMVMRARLDRSAMGPGVGGAERKAASRKVAPPVRPLPGAKQDQTLPNEAAAEIVGNRDALPSSPPPTSAGSTEPDALREPAPPQPTLQEPTHAFFAHAPAQMEALRKDLESARDAAPGDRKELLGDLYLDTHRLCSEARRAELSAALRLASALEAMFKKLFDRPKLCTLSTLDAAAGALDVLEELCHCKADPDLAQPAARILVVDDDPVACRAIAVSLQLVFGRPGCAESGEAAVALAGKRGYDLIFLDVGMPGVDGFTACSQIHATDLNRLTPVVFVTSHSDTVSRAQAAGCGGCGFIPKPVLASQIILVALSYILHGRLGRQMPVLDAPHSLIGRGSEPASSKLVGGDQPLPAHPPGVAM